MGAVNQINLPYRRVAEVALASNAVSVVLAHNHPGGSVLPSLEDIAYTRELKEILDRLNIILADHFILADHAYTSMKSSGMLLD